jgi:hypothetical protein
MTEFKEDATAPAVVVVNTNTTDQAGVAIHAKSRAAAVLAESDTWHGVAGITQSKTGGAGVFGAGDTGGPGVIGTSKTWIGVFGETFGTQNGPAGVWADGHEGGSGVKGHTSCPGAFGVAGFHVTNEGPGIFGKGNPAGLFHGDVNVTGTLNVGGSDVLQRIAAVERGLAAGQQVTARIGAIEQQLAALRTDLDSRMKEHNGRISQLEFALSDLKFRVTRLEGGG